MNISDDILRKLARDIGTPFFVYNLDEVERRIRLLTDLFASTFDISFAMKANPHRAFLDFFKSRISSLDISSGGELKRALASGWKAADISFTGPAKQRWELEYAARMKIGKIVVESIHEANLLNEVLENIERTQDILIRISPDKLPRGFGVNMSGKPNQFGVDEENMPEALDQISGLPRLRLKGFHIYSGTQCLDHGAIVENFENFIALFRHFTTQAKLKPETLIFGSGFGIPYYDGMTELDIRSVADSTLPLLDELRHQDCFKNCGFYLELGRWLIGEAGTYVTTIVSRKDSRGTPIGICDGGMNHHLGACGHLGSFIHRNYRMRHIPKRVNVRKVGDKKSFKLVGPLCTSIDTLGHDVDFPDLEIGDCIAISCSGAYGLTASPVGFISHPPPREVSIQSKNGKLDIQPIANDFMVDFRDILH